MSYWPVGATPKPLNTEVHVLTLGDVDLAVSVLDRPLVAMQSLDNAQDVMVCRNCLGFIGSVISQVKNKNVVLLVSVKYVLVESKYTHAILKPS